MATPLIPEAYIPRSYRDLQEYLSDALATHIESKGLTASDIARRWPTCRAWHVRTLYDPESKKLGVKMLMAMAEATGLRVDPKAIV